MRKFTQITEEFENKKFFQAKAEITLEVEAENEGEAGYLFDSILGGIKEQVDYNLANIEEVSQMTEGIIEKEERSTSNAITKQLQSKSKKTSSEMRRELKEEGFKDDEIDRILKIVYEDREL
jgi:hypothetical protein